MSSDNDSVQDVLDSLDDLFEGAMAPHDEEPSPPPSKEKSPSAAPADEADAILDELLSGGTATGAPIPTEEEKLPHVHPGARDGAVLDDSLNTLIYDSVEEGLNVGHLNTSPTPPPPEEELPSTESLMEDDLLSDLLGDSGFDMEPAPAKKAGNAERSPSPAATGDADAILNELLGGGEPPGNEKPLDEFLAGKSATGADQGGSPAADADATPAPPPPPMDDADAILNDLLGESGTGANDEASPPPSPSADEADAILDGLLSGEGGDDDDGEALSADEADAILDGLLGGGADNEPASETSDADTLLGELTAELEGGAPEGPASPLDTTDEILGDLLGESPAAPREKPAAPAEPEMSFGGDEDALLNELLGGEGPEASDGGVATTDDSDAMLDELMGTMETSAAAPSRDDDVEGLESLEDVFELSDGTITERQPTLTGEAPPPQQGAGEEDSIPLLSDIVIPGDQLARAETGAIPAAASTLDSAQYDDLLNDLAGELQVRLAWRIEQQLKGAMDALIRDALEQASADLKESIREQLKESLPSVIDRLSGR